MRTHEAALGGRAAVNGGRVFFAFDLLRLIDVFVGQFKEPCLRLCIAQRGSVLPGIWRLDLVNRWHLGTWADPVLDLY
jgi:hypothetical protein